MRPNWLIQEYEFRSEVLPVLVVGIMLNLIGRYIGSVLDLPYVFLDMSGTALAAILLGPWWAATVGIAGNAINGNFLSNYFPFGVVNIFGGLAWGYFLRLTGLRNKLLAEHGLSPRILFDSYVILALFGGLACAFSSIITKLVLYPPMGRTFISGSIYENTYHLLVENGIGEFSEITALILVDIFREFLDKGIVVAVALVFVYAMAFFPIPIASMSHSPKKDYAKTDANSIFVFTLIYGVYLLFARLVLPEITFPGAERSIDWLMINSVIWLLYAPIFFAALAFLFFTYDINDNYSRVLDAHRWKRKCLYWRLTASVGWLSGDLKKLNFLKNPQRKSTYALLFSLFLWPLRKNPTQAFTSPMYFALIGILAIIYFYNSWNFRYKCRKADKWLKLIQGWMADCEIPSDPALIGNVLQSMFKGRMLFPERGLLIQGNVAYFPCVLRDTNTFIARNFSGTDQTTILFCLPYHPRLVSIPILDDIDVIIRETSIHSIYLLAMNMTLQDDDIIQKIKSMRDRNIDFNLVAWMDIETGVRLTMQDRNPIECLMRAHTRTLDTIGRKESRGVHDDGSAEWLMQRCLPSLKHILEILPRESMVFDIGCGRGRHALAAINDSHEVLAIDRNPDALSDFRNYLEELNIQDEVRIIQEDFLKIDSSLTGTANLVICTGVLHHSKNEEELLARLKKLKEFASAPGATIFIEMLYDMKIDGHLPEDGRMNVNQELFERLLLNQFSSRDWIIERVNGPIERHQNFQAGPRSFYPISKTVDVTSFEYAIVANS